MKQSEIKELPLKDLQEKLNENKGLYSKMKMEHATTPLENPMQLRAIRKTIARLTTEIYNKKISELN